MQRREPLSEDPRLRRQGLARAAKEERRKREKLVNFSAGGASCSERTPDFVARDSFELRRRNARREGPKFGLTLRAARTTKQHYVALLSIHPHGAQLCDTARHAQVVRPTKKKRLSFSLLSNLETETSTYHHEKPSSVTQLKAVFGRRCDGYPYLPSVLSIWRVAGEQTFPAFVSVNSGKPPRSRPHSYTFPTLALTPEVPSLVL